jgi:hypothetical protein
MLGEGLGGKAGAASHSSVGRYDCDRPDRRDDDEPKRRANWRAAALIVWVCRLALRHLPANVPFVRLVRSSKHCRPRSGASRRRCRPIPPRWLTVNHARRSKVAFKVRGPDAAPRGQAAQGARWVALDFGPRAVARPGETRRHRAGREPRTRPRARRYSAQPAR